jgi:hypothetical protein
MFEPGLSARHQNLVKKHLTCARQKKPFLEQKE